MYGCDPRHTLVVGVERGGYPCQAAHEPVHWWFAAIGALQQPLDFATLAHDKMPTASLDQRRVAKQHTVVGEREPQVIRARFTKAPQCDRWRERISAQVTATSVVMDSGLAVSRRPGMTRGASAENAACW